MGKDYKKNYKNYRFTVYMHVAPNNKKYVGVTYRKLRYRWRKDGSGYKDNEHFWRAIQKYGWNNFEHLIFAEGLTYEDACDLEIALIKQYKTNDEHYGYNKSTGGDIHSLGCVYDEEYRKKISLSKMGSKNPMYGKPSWNKGIPCREETKRKLSLANKGKPNPKGRIPKTEAQKQHLREINLGKIHVTNGEIEKIICKEELEKYVSMGYHRGRKPCNYVKKKKEEE